MVTNPVKLFKSLDQELPADAHIALIGSGMGSLCAAAILAKEGKKVVVFESNYLPGGCSSSYERKGYIFESGATTLVGLDDGMPLKAVMEETGISFNYKRLEIPMTVTLSDGQEVIRYNEFDRWIEEAERVFGINGQAGFWKECFKISKLVWSASSRHLHFPPDNLKDLMSLAGSFRLSDISLIAYLNKSLVSLLKKYDLQNNKTFIEFIDEQLMITAQNKHEDVNALFGSAALCYTLFGNYYVEGGLIKMVEAFTNYINQNGGIISLRNQVTTISRNNSKGFIIESMKGKIKVEKVISGIPLNNLMEIYPEGYKTLKNKTFQIEHLCGAFQVGIVVSGAKKLKSIHHQIHHKNEFPIPGSGSLFLSYSDAHDTTRVDENKTLISISTHVKNPHEWDGDKKFITDKIIGFLEAKGIFSSKDVVYVHSSGPKDWETWTKRYKGFVGGYPQKLAIKPWQMNSARLEKGFYVCGDTVYPGQGIPGVALSGLIAAKKLLSDL